MRNFTKLINLEQICVIRIYLKQEDVNYVYVGDDHKNSWFDWILTNSKKSGFYDILSQEYVTIAEIEKSGIHYCENNEVYLKPHIEIDTANGETEIQYFESVKLLQKFMKKFNNIPTVDIT